jgi:acetolactate synthase-1/2/3 large subunit
MNGAEAMLRTLLACGVDTCFANPGTSEMQFVAALDRVSGLRPVLCLSETVATGCADGYARMSGRPAATLLHCGPGFANGIANLHNARRAHSPIVNIVGDHASWHRPHDPPLASDIAGLAHAASDWVRSIAAPEEIGRDVAAAVAAARAAPGKIATLITPADMAWSVHAQSGEALAPAAPRPIADSVLPDIAAALKSGEPVLLLLAREGLLPRGLAAAERIRRQCGAGLMAPMQVARAARGRGLPRVDRLPYAIDHALAALAPYRHIVLCGARAPTAFFAYPDKPSLLAPPAGSMHTLALPEEDVADALERLAAAVGAASLAAIVPAPVVATQVPGGAPTAESFARALCARLPEQAIVVDDAVSTGRGLFPFTHDAAPHDWLQVTGGSIGFGLPAATGAAIACPGRKVVCLQGDGGAMYALAALWTQARERLDVITVIFANRAYKVLFAEMNGVGASAGPAARRLLELTDPQLDWVQLARGQGVEAVRVADMAQFDAAFAGALSRSGPMLIELVM